MRSTNQIYSQLINTLGNGDKSFNYIISDKGEGHSIYYLTPNLIVKSPTIVESVRNESNPARHSILRELYGSAAMGKNNYNFRISEVIPQEVRQVLLLLSELPNFNINNLSVSQD